jgi:hypothetical protein
MPKIIEKLAYEYKELNGKAKESAEYWYYCNVNYQWIDEHIDGIKRFLELFNVSLKRYELDLDFVEYETDIDKCKFQAINRKHVNKLLTSFKIEYCFDESILSAFKEYYKKYGSVKLAIEYALEKSFYELERNCDHHYTDESMQEFFEANEYLFDEKGGIL